MRRPAAVLAFVISITHLGCGGSAPSTPPPPPPPPPSGPTLVSSTPSDNATSVDRWTQIHFVFSAPLAATQQVSTTCVSTCNALPLYDWKVSGAELIGTPRIDGLAALGTAYRLSVTPTGADGIAGVAVNVPFTTAAARTTISSDITTDTTLTKDGSPYVLDPAKVVYLNNATLTLSPGVEFIGVLNLLGSARIVAVGAADSRIHMVQTALVESTASSCSTATCANRLSYVDFSGFMPLSPPAQIDHSTLDCEGTFTANVNRWIGIGAGGAITDSRLLHCGLIAGSAIVFERNIWLKPALLIIDPRSQYYASFASFTNNYIDLAGSQQFMSVDGAGLVGSMKRNSFLNEGANSFGGGGDGGSIFLSGTVDLSDNWWGTTDTQKIGTYIMDSQDNSQLPYTFNVLPILAAPDAATPTP